MSPKPSTDIINIANGIPIKTDLLAEVAPGVFVGNLPSQHTPRYGLVKYVSDKKGGMTSVVVSWSGLVKVSKTLPEKIGIQLNKKVLRALVYSGLVKGTRPTPFITMIDLHSLSIYLRESAKPGFWTPARRDAYSLGWNDVQLLPEDEE